MARFNRRKKKSDDPEHEAAVAKVFSKARWDAYHRRKEAVERMRPLSTEEEVKAKIFLTQDEVDAWNQIAAGKPMRNSTAVLQAIKMKMEYTIKKPASESEGEKSRIEITVNTLGKDEIKVEEIPVTQEKPDAIN